jgi:hypothetical protein
VLRLLMLTKGSKKGRGGFISYAQLGINQLGAVYEGLMSYTGSIATEQLYEVAKNGDPKDGSWIILASKADEYDDHVFVVKENPITGVRSRVSYAPGQFVYRLAGRDRQTSASYYTPHTLTEVTVQLALKYGLDQDGTTTPARELLDWTICEPALGSGAFLNEAINQVAAEYLRRRQDEVDIALDPEQYHLELQRVKAYIALHNCYGVDLNRTAVELAEVSLWLNVMHKGLQAPWFGLHLQRGNSLIGGGRRLYAPGQLADKSWLTTAPEHRPFRDGAIIEGTIHHFLLPAEGWGAVAGEKKARDLAPDETESLKKWRSAIKRLPKAAGRNSQVKRLQALARRVEFLWDLVQQRLTISEREIRRDIAVWEAQDLPAITEAVPREKILEDLTRLGTPYWRLKTLMDTWCALWFWPLDKVGLLDGSAHSFTAILSEVTHIKDLPVQEEPAVYEKVPLFGDVEPQQLGLPTKTVTRKVTIAEQLRQQLPLADLDDWLTFAEALIGRQDIPIDSLITSFISLVELGEYEGAVVALMGMEQAHRLTDRFPWLHTARDIADEQGFFHWELAFAQAFAKGGFDVQVGNPPWVRPRWLEDALLAEHDPWFQLAEKPLVEVSHTRRSSLLENEWIRWYVLNELGTNAGLVSFLSHKVTYPLLTGTQPDRYRSFMCQVWTHASARGIAGLVHPDSHFNGAYEGVLRSATYAHLRLHGHFQNQRLLFPDIDWSRQYSTNIYGSAREIDFIHASWLFDPRVLIDSLEHDNSGEAPAIKHDGYWDLRPHRSRIVIVDTARLANWQRLRGEMDMPVEQTPLLYPVTTHEERAITSLSEFGHRLGAEQPWISRGYDESGAQQASLIREELGRPERWDEVILRGPQLSIATPFAKQPPRTGRYDDPSDLIQLDENAVPTTDYTRACEVDTFKDAQDLWGTRRYTEYYRVAWRRRIPYNTERSLFAAFIPPGPAHIDPVHTLALSNNAGTVLVAGFWASLPLDYLLRVTGRADLRQAEAKVMPAGDPRHPLAQALILRTLRLNCLTKAYAPLWRELFDPAWQHEVWGVAWPGLLPLSTAGGEPLSRIWTRPTALRTEFERRAALIEIDTLVAVWLGMGIEELVAIYLGRFPQLVDYEAVTWFDGNGRKIAGDRNAFGRSQTKEHYEQLLAYQQDPLHNPVPDGYAPPGNGEPFYKADREQEYREAHAVFSQRLQESIDAGWQSS